MVMGRVRATSYVRRTLSQPAHQRRSSAIVPGGGGTGGNCVGTVGAPSRNLHLQLLVSDSSIAAIGEEAEYATFTAKDDMFAVYNILCTKFNLLLLFVPLGVISHYAGWSKLAVFWLNFIALIPLASLLGNATEELAQHTGEIVGGLLNASFGNAVEMIMSVQALKKGLISVVQGTLLGSILSNLLLVLGMSFFAGGIFHHVQKFNEKGATCSTSLLFLSSMGITIPTVAGINAGSGQEYEVLMISRITAVLIGITYCLFLFFQLYTHLGLFQDEEGVGEEWPTMSWVTATLMLFFITLLVSILSEFLVDSIESVVVEYGLSEGFIGVILLPIVGNAAEHMTAVTVAMKNKVDLTMGVAVGSSAQIALFVVPFTVIVGWILDKPMTLAFQPLSAITLVMSIIVAMAVVQDGECNWLEGVMLVAAYLIIAVVFWYDQSSSVRKE